VIFISDAISDGADGFLRAEYVYVFVFMAAFGVILFTLNAVASADSEKVVLRAALTTVSFLVGAATSMLCGYLGMKIAVLANSRVAVSAYRHNGFNPPFQVRMCVCVRMCATYMSMYVMVAVLLRCYVSHLHSLSHYTSHYRSPSRPAWSWVSPWSRSPPACSSCCTCPTRHSPSTTSTTPWMSST
jgi:Na+/H+-translocating membrane pyrophosphatase